MTTKSITLLHKQILPHASGCAVPVMNNNIITIIQKMCEEARIWRYRATITLVDGDTPLVTPADSVLFEIDNVKFDGVPIDPISYSDLDTENPDWENWSGGDQPRFYTQENPNTLLFVPFVAGDAIINMYLKPSDDAIVVPDWFVDQYSKMIGWGVLSEVLLIPKQQYTSPEKAVYYRDKFQEMLDGLSSFNIKGQQRASSRTKPQFF